MKSLFLIFAGILAFAGNAHANDEIDACVAMMESAKKPMNHDKAVWACTNEFLDPFTSPESMKPESWRRELAEDIAQAREEAQALDHAEQDDFAPAKSRMQDHFKALSEE